jgi:hypothetical protein
MKKALCVFLCLSMLTVFAFSLEESWLNMGFAYGNSIDIHPNQAALNDGYTGSPGIALTLYQFWDSQKVGMFLGFSGTSLMVSSVPGDIKNYGSALVEGLIGLGFRRHLAKGFTLGYAGGFDFLYESLSYRGAGDELVEGRTMNFGIGGDIGVKLDITDILSLRIGTIASYHCINHTRFDGQTSYDSEWSVNSRFGIQPYLSIGLNAYSQERKIFAGNFNDQLGKP